MLHKLDDFFYYVWVKTIWNLLMIRCDFQLWCPPNGSKWNVQMSVTLQLQIKSCLSTIKSLFHKMTCRTKVWLDWICSNSVQTKINSIASSAKAQKQNKQMKRNNQLPKLVSFQKLLPTWMRFARWIYDCVLFGNKSYKTNGSHSKNMINVMTATWILFVSGHWR